jgi:phospho-N-acetylmuramoyl-pentapeptide-transferase
MAAGWWAVSLAFLFVWVTGPLMIPMLRGLKFGQQVRDDGPQKHLVKMGTPTMGGMMIIAAIVFAAIVTGPRTIFLWTALIAVIGFSCIGFADDYLKVVLKRPLGLKARAKLAAQILGGVALAIVVAGPLGLGTALTVPFTAWRLELGIFYYLFVLIMVLGTVNGVNLADGLDGLAAGTMVFPLFILAVIAGVQAQTDLQVLALAGLGACIGFLIYNRHPAKIFMGDTGSFALGSLLAALVLLTKTELLVIVLGGVYVIESVSVILQVIILRITGRRVFKMAPLHHHFELSGWEEQRVVRMFWLLALLFSGLGYLGFMLM